VRDGMFANEGVIQMIGRDRVIKFGRVQLVDIWGCGR
jgi:hypothetical protein